MMDILAGRENALISVIIPVYNTAQYLCEAIESVLGQTYVHWELILVDDGSTDGSGAICDEYAGKDDRIRVIHTENRGVSCARNAGLDAAQGEWICFIDSDDWVEEHALAYLLENSADADVVMCALEGWKKRGISSFHEAKVFDGTENAEDNLLTLNHFNFEVFVWGKLYRAASITERFMQELTFGEDTLFNLAQIKKWKKIVVFPKSIYHYRDRENSLCHTISFDYVHAVQMLFDSYCAVYGGCREVMQRQSELYLGRLMLYFRSYAASPNAAFQIRMLVQIWLEESEFDSSRVLTENLGNKKRKFWNRIQAKDAEGIYRLLMEEP